MRIDSLPHIADLDPGSWNGLVKSDNPFIKHEFLHALEETGCVGGDSGWQACHLLARDGGRLVGALPCYLKSHSWGEFVFDFAWADAYARSGRAYYPKAVSAVPYTPAGGPRLLVSPAADAAAVRRALLTAAREQVAASGASSFHCLFPTQEEAAFLETQGCALRIGCQYHWHNRGYTGFDHFLDTFSADKRKKVKRERRRVREAGIEVLLLEGPEVTPALWQVFYRFYRDTLLRKSGYLPLSLEFFRCVGRILPEHVVLALARWRGDYVAAALSFRGGDTLYGRYWGASHDFHSLHFELCYYAGIDYCIRTGLQRFEPGAQGEHKISRGFVPTATYSAHWLADPVFHRLIRPLLDREREDMRYHMEALDARAPYKSAPT
jgi:predicted N-acyltransferase